MWNDKPILTSIIIPCWNALGLTQVCLERLLRNTTQPYELILVDNGSIDGTGAWIKTFKLCAGECLAFGMLKRIKILSNKSNRGYTAAMNAGIRASRGELLLFGNSDVAVTPLWLESMTEAILSGPRTGGVFPCSNPMRDAGGPAEWAWAPWYKNLEGLDKFALKLMMDAQQARSLYPAKGLVPGFWFMARRAAIVSAGCFDERFSPGGYEDLDLQWRLRSLGWRLGFAGRAYVHHIWFGACETNNLPAGQLYNDERSRLLYDKYPGAARLPLEVRCPFKVKLYCSGNNIYKDLLTRPRRLSRGK